jgi:hypothetical protein
VEPRAPIVEDVAHREAPHHELVGEQAPVALLRPGLGAHDREVPGALPGQVPGLRRHPLDRGAKALGAGVVGVALEAPDPPAAVGAARAAARPAAPRGRRRSRAPRGPAPGAPARSAGAAGCRGNDGRPPARPRRGPRGAPGRPRAPGWSGPRSGSRAPAGWAHRPSPSTLGLRKRAAPRAPAAARGRDPGAAPARRRAPWRPPDGAVSRARAPPRARTAGGGPRTGR